MKLAISTSALLAAALLSAPVLYAQDAPDSGESAVSDILLRDISFADLGFGGGTTFTQLSGEQEVYFPVPDTTAIRGATLFLDLDHGARTDTPRFLMVEVGGRVIHSADLRTVGPRDRIEVAVDHQMSQAGYLPVRIVYSGALTDEECYDTRASGDFVTIASTSHLRLSVDADDVDTAALVAELQPRSLAISVPGGSYDPARVSAAMRLATVFGAESGLAHIGADPAQEDNFWSTGLIRIEDAAAAGSRAAALSAGHDTGRPMLTISGRDPQRAVEVLDSPWSKLAGAGSLATDGSAELGTGSRHVRFDSLGFDPRARRVSSSTAYEFNFDIADIPRGSRPDSVSLHVAAAPDWEGEGATLVAYLNDGIVGSHALSGGDPTWVDFDLPAEEIRRNNRLQVEFLRQPRGGRCALAVQGYPVQVLPDSRLNLSPHGDEADDFSDMRQDMQDGVDLLIDAAFTESTGEVLDYIAPIVASVVPGKAPIDTVAALDPDLSARPFIVVSDVAPVSSNPRLRLDEGLVELRSASGEVLFNGTDLSRLGLVQIIDVGNRRGLWIRIGSGEPPRPTVRRPLILDSGDVAVVGGDGLMLATRTSRRDVVRVSYLETRVLTQLLERYWALIVGIAWAILTVIVLGVLQRQYRKRKADSSE